MAKHGAMADGNLDMISQAGESGTARVASRRPRIGKLPVRRRHPASKARRPRHRPRATAAPDHGPVALVIGALGLYLATGRYVSEENAYMQAVTASIRPQVAG